MTGLTAVALTPNIKVAAVLSSNFYSLYNLFAGFIMPEPQVPGWWIWMIYLNPCYWYHLPPPLPPQAGTCRRI